MENKLLLVIKSRNQFCQIDGSEKTFSKMLFGLMSFCSQSISEVCLVNNIWYLKSIFCKLPKI